MPTNLNALVRFKQIDICLRSPYLKATINVLQDRCSRELEKQRGIPSISERTIREDIKVMRSDALGFNAPIVVKNGIYSYSDPEYSIFKTSIHEIDLLKRIQDILVNEREKIQDFDIGRILLELSIITGVELPEIKETAEVAESEVLENITLENEFRNINELISENRQIKVFKKSKDKSDKEHLNSFNIDFNYKSSNQQLEETSLKGIYQWSRVFDLL